MPRLLRLPRLLCQQSVPAAPQTQLKPPFDRYALSPDNAQACNAIQHYMQMQCRVGWVGGVSSSQAAARGAAATPQKDGVVAAACAWPSNTQVHLTHW